MRKAKLVLDKETVRVFNGFRGGAQCASAEAQCNTLILCDTDGYTTPDYGCGGGGTGIPAKCPDPAETTASVIPCVC